MSATEIILIIAGVIILALGYMVPARKKDIDDDLQLVSEDEARKLIDKEMEDVKEDIADIVDETITYSMEKAERSMERLTNEKIMAMNEYSDTVLEEINKNHKEVLFLYDMLNDKEENLKLAVSDALKLSEEIRQTVKDAEITARETKEAVTNMELAAKEAEEAVQTAEENADPAESFHPFVPPRVEIIHDPDGDYVASQPDDETPETEKKPKRSRKPRQTADARSEEKPKPARKRTRKTEEKETETEILLVEDDPEQFRLFREKPQDTATMDSLLEDGNSNMRNSNDRILELHKAGKSTVAIAKELGLGIGEVKLVIDLFEGL